MPTALSLVPPVVALVSLVLAVGPAASAARDYVARLEASSPSARTPRIRHPRLLERRPQAVVALALLVPVTWWGVLSGALADTVVALPFVAVLGAACCVDAVCHRLPDRLLGRAALWLIAATVVRLGAEVVSGAPVGEATRPVGRAALSALGVGLVMYLLAMLPSGMGLGDVKLSALCALWLGRLSVEASVAGVMLGFLLGGLTAVVLLVLRRAGRKQRMAFGPYLGAGAWLAWLLAVT